MLRSHLRQLIKEIIEVVIHRLNERIQPKFFWMNPSGELIKVGMYEHDPWAVAYLTKINKMPEDGDVWGRMAELGWYRVTLFSSFSDNEFVEYTFPKLRPPSQKQIKSLKDFAIENNATLQPQGF